MTMLVRPVIDWSALETEEKQYRRLYLATFALFLIVALFARLLPPQWRRAGAVRNVRTSILAEARATAHATMAYAFMQ